MLEFVFSCCQSLIFSELSIINVEFSVLQSKTKYEKGEPELYMNFIGWKG